MSEKLLLEKLDEMSAAGLENLTDITPERSVRLLQRVQAEYSERARQYRLPEGSNPMIRTEQGIFQLGFSSAERHKGTFWVVTFQPHGHREDEPMPFVGIFQADEGSEPVEVYGSQAVFDLAERYLVS